MARKGAIETNKRRSELIRRYKAKRTELIARARDAALPAEERFAARLALAKLPRNASPVRHRNRCEISGRSRGYYRKFGLSRIALRGLASSGRIPGIVKSSW